MESERVRKYYVRVVLTLFGILIVLIALSKMR
jgi:hypothetical protein